MNMNRRTLVCLSSVLLTFSAPLRAETTMNVYDYISDQKIADMPEGSFASWSDEDKKNALQKAFRSCMFQCGMAFAAPTASAQLNQEQGSTCTLACIAKHLPDDDPREANIQGQAQQHYLAAKQLGSQLAPPTFAHEVPTPPPPSAEDLAKIKAVQAQADANRGPSIVSNPDTIPWIGHFSLSPGHKSSGTFGKARIDVFVDATGASHFLANGKEVDSVEGPRTPGAGRSTLIVVQNNDDKSVHFMVSECLPPPGSICAENQRNWDFEQGRLSK